MRIIAGEWRGRKLAAPDGLETRPSADRLREALFSMLASRLGSFEGLHVADLYAGSGALGLEAVSRGAVLACFVEQDGRALAAIRANIDSLGAGERCRVIAGSVERLPVQQPFDLLFADPPYGDGSGIAALQHIGKSGWAGYGAWISIETRRGEKVDPQGWTIDSERDVGSARLTLLRA